MKRKAFHAIVFICLGLPGGFIGVAHAGAEKGSLSVLGVECAKVQELGIDKQENLRASLIRIGCGIEPAGEPELLGGGEGNEPVVDVGNVNTITGAETYPKVTQSESMVWSTPDSSTIVVNYNDSSTAPSNYSGVSVSTDGGATFTRLLPAPFATGHGTNFGDPIVVYNVALGRWFAGDMATGCGGLGVGLWTSTNGVAWTTGACAHTSSNDDRESMWVDNNRNSPYFGRMYISVNNYAAGQRIYSTYSDDGTTWSSPVQVSATFIRNIQVTGSPDNDGTVFIAGMDEGSGGLDNRTNIIYRSTDGGAHWTQIMMGPRFAPPGVTGCGYFAMIPPLWRHMGWGQPGVGPNGVVHYAYAGRGINTGDIGDIYYTRSLDNGTTWSTPIILNTDSLLGGNRAQWMPSLSVTPDGKVQVTWYDRRNSTDGMNYEYWGIQSPDNGDTWGADAPISDTLIAQPEQPDSSFVGCYAGDYNYQTSNDTTTFITWTDGRNPISGHFQQDVYFTSLEQTTTGGILQGRVTSDADGSPIAGARVRAVGPADRTSTSGTDGAYRFRLPQGSYTLTTIAFGFLTGSVSKVQVIDGLTTTQDIALTPAPSHRVSGTVTSSATGAPLANAEVKILSTPIPSVRTDQNGVYIFASVPDGSYNLQASSGRCLAPRTVGITVGPDIVQDLMLDARIDGFGYACDDTIPFNWIAADTLTSLTGDDASIPVALPFPFMFYGQVYSTFHVSTNGFGNFLAPDVTYNNVCIPDPARPNGMLAPLWDDLLVNRPAGVYTALQGDFGSRQFIIEWRDVTFFGAQGAATFEIILNEADNSIVYQYNRADVSGDGRSATLGIENQTGTIGNQYSCNEAIVTVGMAVRYYLVQ